jgi:hypothetical protein
MLNCVSLLSDSGVSPLSKDSADRKLRIRRNGVSPQSLISTSNISFHGSVPAVCCAPRLKGIAPVLVIELNVIWRLDVGHRASSSKFVRCRLSRAGKRKSIAFGGGESAKWRQCSMRYRPPRNGMSSMWLDDLSAAPRSFVYSVENVTVTRQSARRRARRLLSSSVSQAGLERRHRGTLINACRYTCRSLTFRDQHQSPGNRTPKSRLPRRCSECSAIRVDWNCCGCWRQRSAVYVSSRNR